MYANPQTQLPVSPEQVDQSTFNQNLPQGNEVFPQIRLPQSLHPDVAGLTVSLFRWHAQSRSNKTNLHIFTYNLFSQNRFANQLYATWCQRAVDFADFLVNAQRNNPNDAAQKASAKVYLSALAVIGSEFPAVAQLALYNAGNQGEQVKQQLIAQLQEWQDMQRDIHSYQTARQGGGAPGYGGMNPGAVGSHFSAPQNSSVQSLLNAHTSGSAPPSHTGAPGGAPGRSSGMLLDAAPTAPTPTSWTAGQPLAPAQPATQGGSMSAQVQDYTDEQVPQTVEALIVDPRHYMPRGFVMDLARPYDEIYNPGGIEIRPAHLTTWKRTVGDDQPYRKQYDSSRFVLFYAKWPSGVVKEVLVSTQDKPEMDYLLHEISDQLRQKAIQANGKVVPSDTGILDSDKPAQPLGVVRRQLDEQLDGDTQALSPVILDRVFNGTSDLEDERDAKLDVVDALGLDPEGVVPAHEYRSWRLHPMDVSQDCYTALSELRNANSFEAVVAKLRSLLEENQLPIRYYRFIDDRLTQAVNTYLKDSLSMVMSIDSFYADVADIGPFLAKHHGAQYQKVFDSCVPHVLGKALVFAELDNELQEGETEVSTVRGLTDQFINFQVGWTQQDLENLQVGKEPVLLSQYTHPRIVAVIKGMVDRAKENELLDKSRLRIVTREGCYYEVIRGMLVKNALLLKRV